MNKFLVAVLLVALLVSGFALAEERPYVRQIHQNMYINTLFITPESYPEVRLSTGLLSSMISGYSEPWVIRFGAPENSQLLSYNTDDCAYINPDQGIQYSYQGIDNYSFESLLNKCENDDYIVAEGSEGYAAYVDPEGQRAYAVVGLREISKSAKLYVSIYMSDFLSSDTVERRAAILAETISAECTRIIAEKRVQLEENFWSTNAYRGVKMPSLSHGSDMLVLDFPQLPLQWEDGTSATVEPYLYQLEDNRMKLCAVDGKNYLEIEIEMDRYSYAVNKQEDEPDNCHAITLSDGTQYLVYLPIDEKYTETSMAYAARLLATDAGYNKNDDLYLSIDFSGSGNRWSSVEQIVPILEAMAQNMRIADVNDDPYVPGEGLPAGVNKADKETVADAPAAEQAPAPAATGWVCPACSTENTGNFCTNCGAAKPAANWVCPSCNAENTGNFCSNCGTKRP